MKMNKKMYIIPSTQNFVCLVKQTLLTGSPTNELPGSGSTEDGGMVKPHAPKQV